MKRDEVVVSAGSLLLVILIVVGVGEGLWTVTSVLGYMPYFLILGIFALLGWGFRARLQTLGLRLSQPTNKPSKDNRTFPKVMDRLQQQAEKDAVDRMNKLFIILPVFGPSLYPHLTLHFSHKKDTPQQWSRPAYIVNHDSKIGFWTPDFIVRLAGSNWIQQTTHAGEPALREYLDANKIKLNERYPLNYKRELGISLSDLSEKLMPATPVNPAQQSDREVDDFRSGVAAEVRSLLKMFSDPLHHWDISYPTWSSKAEQSKATLLGNDYLVLRRVYDAIEVRNKYFAKGTGMNLEDVSPLNRACVEAFSRAYREVTWLKKGTDNDSLLSKAMESVGLSPE